MIEWAERNEQLAEWLEELKAIKSDGFTDNLLNMGFSKGYNKALEDFAEKLKQKNKIFDISNRMIDELAELLKEGKENE